MTNEMTAEEATEWLRREPPGRRAVVDGDGDIWVCMSSRFVACGESEWAYLSDRYGPYRRMVVEGGEGT